MATPSQRRKEKHKRKRQEKRDQLRKRQENLRRTLNMPMPDISSVSQARHRQRLLAQVPRAWPGETPEDAAVWDDSVLKTLSPELALQAVAVRDALKSACESRAEEALKCTSSIPRSSPYSQWRLFVRGLVSWLDDDTQAASEAWERLDPDRRPGRIAAAMMNSLNPNLEEAKAVPVGSPGGEATPINWADRLDEALLYHAKLLRRVRFDRAAIRIAEAGLKVPEESKELIIGPRKIAWLRKFVSEYRDTEPELTKALSQVALHRAYSQEFIDLFQDATQALEGPPHDRRNLLLTYFYHLRFEDTDTKANEPERILERYLKDDLAKNETLTAPLRAALTSQIHWVEAIALIRPKVGGLMSMMIGPENSRDVRKHLKASIKAYPANRAAHKTYADWLESQLDDDNLTQKKREPIAEELTEVMANWSRGLPEDIEPRLWLVDHLLENERLEEARPHVDWLAACRHDDPRVRATPWKWQLLEAMRLCRRKAWLPEAAARLDDAERIWPAWLSRAWLPYLRAAVSLRAGKREAFEAERELIWRASEGTRGSLADACMMLSAAQLMRIPANELKPLRAPVDQAVSNLGKVSEADLLRVSNFFWDLHRVHLLYPAYRMHGKKIADAIRDVLQNRPKLVLERLEDVEIHSAVLLCSEHRCFSGNDDLKLPSWFSAPAVQKHRVFLAAQVNALLKLKYYWSVSKYKDLCQSLREAATLQRDAYYRYWFGALADELQDLISARPSSPFGFDFNPFNEIFGDDEGDEEYDDEDDLPFDPECDCPDCRAARRAYEASR